MGAVETQEARMDKQKPSLVKSIVNEWKKKRQDVLSELKKNI